jgi:hypothetical protein
MARILSRQATLTGLFRSASRTAIDFDSAWLTGPRITLAVERQQHREVVTLGFGLGAALDRLAP